MGSISYKYLIPVDEARPPAEALSGSSNVGGRPLFDTTSAMTIVRNESGELIFGAEVPMQVVNRRRTVTTHSGRRLSWVRLEFKADRKTGEIERNDVLILTEYPWSSLWWQHALFRGVSKKSHVERADDPSLWDIEDFQEIVSRLERLSYDYWETDGNYLTAGVSQPAPTMAVHRGREQKTAIQQVYGLSRSDPIALAAELLECSTAKSLSKMTQDRTIAFWPPGAPPAMRVLHDETIRDATVLLDSAIHQALAGPPNLDDEEALPWADRPVIALADHIYRRHLYNANRRHLKADAHENFDDIAQRNQW